MKVGEEGDSKSNGRGLLNGMDRDCKDFKYAGQPSPDTILNFSLVPYGFL